MLAVILLCLHKEFGDSEGSTSSLSSAGAARPHDTNPAFAAAAPGSPLNMQLNAQKHLHSLGCDAIVYQSSLAKHFDQNMLGIQHFQLNALCPAHCGVGTTDDPEGKLNNIGLTCKQLSGSMEKFHRIQITTAETKRLGLYTQRPEEATNFPVIISSMLDHVGTAVFIFCNLFGAKDLDDLTTVVEEGAVFTCKVNGRFLSRAEPRCALMHLSYCLHSLIKLPHLLPA
jgi:hypothetical protein